MTKILNIDSILPSTDRKIILGGKEYEISCVTVKNFIRISEFEEKISKEKDLPKQVDLLIALVKGFIPEMDESVLTALTFKQLQLIVDFIRDEIPDEMLEGAEPKEAPQTQETEEGKADPL